jgi:predicted Zn-dependent protease
VLRNKAEVYRAKRKIEIESVKDYLDKLKKLSDKINYRFGKIYYFLISGGLCLQKNNSKDAESFFKDAISLSTQDPGPLKIEHAHSLFGLAETQRFNENFIESIKQYKKSNKMYKEIGSVWGIIRTSIGLAIIDDTSRVFRKSIKKIEKIDSPIDRALITKLDKGDLKSDEILFLNIP